MPLISLRRMLDHAQENQYALPAFNINFQEQAQAVLAAARHVNSPVIIQVSAGGLDYAANWFIDGLIAHAKSSPLPICIHRDHAHSLPEIQQAVHLGFSSVMMDGSLMPDGTPASLEHNINISQEAIKIAASTGASVEGEVGCLGSLETSLAGEEDGSGANRALSYDEMLTCPKQAETFISQAPVDALAIAIGTSHGASKFIHKPSSDTLCIERVQEIHHVLPKQHLVLHGCSSVPQDLLHCINQHGGEIPITFGVPIKAIQACIPHGVRKVNIDTDLRLACTAAIRQHLTENPGSFDPRSYLHQAAKLMEAICIDRYTAFGSTDQAPSLIRDIHEADSSIIF